MELQSNYISSKERESPRDDATSKTVHNALGNKDIESSTKRLKRIPIDMALKFSQKPRFIANNLQLQSKTSTSITTFIYLVFNPAFELSELFRVISNEIWRNIVEVKANITDHWVLDDEYLYDRLTKSTKSLHISLSYNITFGNISDFGIFIEKLKGQSEKTGFPMNVKFKKDVGLFPNPENSKVFFGLMLDDDSKNSIKELVKFINKSIPQLKGSPLSTNNMEYNIDYMHLSIGQILRKKDTQLELSSTLDYLKSYTKVIDNYLEATVDGIFITKGREKIRL